MDPLHNLITKIYGSVADSSSWSETLTEVTGYLGAEDQHQHYGAKP